MGVGQGRERLAELAVEGLVEQPDLGDRIQQHGPQALVGEQS